MGMLFSSLHEQSDLGFLNIWIPCRLQFPNQNIINPSSLDMPVVHNLK